MYEYTTTFLRMGTHILTGVCKIIEGQFPAFQLFPSSNLVLETVESLFQALNYFANASTSAKDVNSDSLCFIDACMCIDLIIQNPTKQ
jgi:hypothetical protein